MKNKMFNWKEIQKIYPKSFTELTKSWADIRFMDNDGNDSNNLHLFLNHADCIEFDYRSLYDFFDSKMIELSIFRTDFNWFMYTIHYWPGLYKHLFTFRKRIHAEEEGFLKAFEILELKLNED